MRRPEEVFVIVRRGGEYLVLHRSPRGGAYWHSVAGALEDGESYLDAARRELLEETGLAAEPVEFGEQYAHRLDESSEFRALFPSGTEQILVCGFLVEAPQGWEPQLDHEHDDYRWCSRDEALGLLYWPEARACLSSLAAGA